MRQGEEEAGKIAQEYRLGAQHEQEYAETAAALAETKELSAAEAAEVSQLWRKLVKLFHPDRFAHEPEKQEAVGKTRNPNIEIRNKFQNHEGRKMGAAAPPPFFGISIPSDLFRISDFGFSLGEEREITHSSMGASYHLSHINGRFGGGTE